MDNLDVVDGMLVPHSPGLVGFTIEGECQRERWSGFATDAPFLLEPGRLSFPLTRPTENAALPVSATNQTDDNLALEFLVPSAFSAQASLQLQAREAREFFVFFAPPSLGTFDGELAGTAFAEVTRTVALRGVAGGPVVGIVPNFDAGVVAALGPQQRPDGRWVQLSNDAPVEEGSQSALLLPAVGASDCAGVQVMVDKPGLLLPGSSTRILLLLPSEPLGSFSCNVTLASTPRPVAFRVVWNTVNVPCDISWPVGPVATDAGFATIELVTGLDGCRLTFPRLEPADAGTILAGWGDLDVPPQTVVPLEVYVSRPAELRVNVSDPAIRSLSVSVVP